MLTATKTVLLAVLVLLLTLFTASLATAAGAITTELYDVQGRVVGSATLTGMEDGMTEVVVTVAGMDTVGGDRRVAITEHGYCSDDGDYSSAGDDIQALPNVQFYVNGGADYKYVVEGVDIAALADSDGSALVIYADAGDNPGTRIICGLLHEDSALWDANTEPPPAEEAPATPDTDVVATPEVEDAATPETEEVATPATEDAATPEATDSERTLEDALNEGYGAVLRDVQGRAVGLALMLETNDGQAGVTFYLEGMQAVGGDRRVALTETNVCEAPEFSSAGAEVATLPNVQFYSVGAADYSKLIPDLDLDSLADENGSAVVIYADAGDAPGARIICGSITSAAETLGYYGVTVEEFATFVTLVALES
jgi:Cu/Zn superoxide dismutase